ncbi:MAG TPA: hypothetical protein VJM31_05335 [Vicinamibacterales bacterium]|nr:hypothetical protein [Vicinamibacterales bacterium]
MTKRTLEIDEDLDFQRKEWLWQRIGIAMLILFVLVALLGLTGAGGPLSHGAAGDRGSPIHIEYERVVRRGARATMKLHLRSNAPGAIQFWVSAPYVEHVKIETVLPQPDGVSVDQSRQVYTIRSDAAEATVLLHAEHLTIGRLHGEIGLVGGPSVQFSQVSLF